MSPGLEGAEHGHHEGVLGKGQDVSLHEGLLDLVPQHQVLPVDLFHGKALPGLLVPDQVHSPRGRQTGKMFDKGCSIDLGFLHKRA